VEISTLLPVDVDVVGSEDCSVTLSSLVFDSFDALLDPLDVSKLVMGLN
jgi:hypothetical protein